MSTSRFPAIELLRRLGDLPLDDPIRMAAMYEARARHSLALARSSASSGHVAAAEIFTRQYTEDMAKARAVLAAAAVQGAPHAA